MLEAPPVVLTIAGFDPSSGAGVTADIKTIAAQGCYGLAAITALTVQSTAGVRRVCPIDPELLVQSLEELTADVKVSGVHVGMLGSGEVALALAGFLSRAQLPNLVLDPILKASSGTGLTDDRGLEVLTEKLLPLSAVVTPNVEEAEVLTGCEIQNPEHMKQAARKLHEMGAHAVVITGGHLNAAVDILSLKDDYTQIFRADRIDSPNTHGTGCAFATAIACQLALGRSLSAAVLLSKAYVTSTIRHSYAIGRGAGPVNHMYQMRNHPRVLATTKKLASGKS